MTVKLGNEALAEAHDLGIGFAVGVKVGAALAAAHGESGQGILEDLLKAEELNDGKVDRGMEAKAALVRSDSGVELYTVAAVDLNLAVVVNPGNAEHDNALGLYETLNKAGCFPFGMLGNDELEALEDLFDCLKELGLTGMVFLNVSKDALKILVSNHFFFLSYEKIDTFSGIHFPIVKILFLLDTTYNCEKF